MHPKISFIHRLPKRILSWWIIHSFAGSESVNILVQSPNHVDNNARTIRVLEKHNARKIIRKKAEDNSPPHGWTE